MNESESRKDPILQLQENATSTFNRILNANKSAMKCAQGCTECCRTKISVFESEAHAILDWFSGLDSADRQTLIATLSERSESPEDCAFLRKGACAIYPARPVICRTQGAPLVIEREEKKSVHQTVDVCPLNFSGGTKLPERGDWIDLDRLNTLVSIAQREYDKSCNPSDLSSLRTTDDRISLSKLKKFIMDTRT